MAAPAHDLRSIRPRFHTLVNKWLRRLGHPPVIYSQQATSQSASQLRLAMINRGYMGATVHVDTATHSGDKKIDVTYHVNTGKAHRVNK